MTSRQMPGRGRRSYNRLVAPATRGASPLILVAFLLPLAAYLFVLAWINRQPRPVVVSGTWDFLGLLFASSGFLLLGGPAVLSSLNECWRRFWLLGDGSGLPKWLFGDGRSLPNGLDHYRDAWLLLAAGYFVAVVAGSGWMLARRRRLTCVFNVEPGAVEASLEETYRHLGLHPAQRRPLRVRLRPAAGQSRLAGTATGPGQCPARSRIVLRAEARLAALGSRTTRRSAWSSSRRCDSAWRTAAPEHESAAWLNFTASMLLIASLFLVILLLVRMMWPARVNLAGMRTGPSTLAGPVSTMPCMTSSGTARPGIAPSRENHGGHGPNVDLAEARLRPPPARRGDPDAVREEGAAPGRRSSSSRPTRPWPRSTTRSTRSGRSTARSSAS